MKFFFRAIDIIHYCIVILQLFVNHDNNLNIRFYRSMSNNTLKNEHQFCVVYIRVTCIDKFYDFIDFTFETKIESTLKHFKC